MNIKVKKLDETAILPTRGSSSAAGWDLYALPSAGDVILEGGETKLVHTGIAVEIPDGYFGATYARSGLATKQGIRPANCVGIIDSDYRGEVMVAAHSDNNSFAEQTVEISPGVGKKELRHLADSVKTINGGDRIAQLIIQKYEEVEMEEVSDLSATDRGEGGFGSTGTN